MTLITQIDLYMALKGKIGESEAKLIAEYIDQKVDHTFDIAKDQLATKSDTNRIDISIADVHAKITEAKADLLKWMFVLFAPFYVGLIVFLIKQFL
jgi:hypothetical protein